MTVANAMAMRGGMRETAKAVAGVMILNGGGSVPWVGCGVCEMLDCGWDRISRAVGLFRNIRASLEIIKIYCGSAVIAHPGCVGAPWGAIGRELMASDEPLLAS